MSDTLKNLTTIDSTKKTVYDPNTVLHHVRWASALTRDQKLESEQKGKEKRIQNKSIHLQSQKDREFTLKMLNLLKQPSQNKVQVDKVVIKNVMAKVQRGNVLKARIKQMKRERQFPQPRTLKNRNYQYGFIPKNLSKQLQRIEK